MNAIASTNADKVSMSCLRALSLAPVRLMLPPALLSSWQLVQRHCAECCRHSATWFWHRAGFNTLADKGDFLTITKRINDGTNGQADRQMRYGRALKVLP
ncbi:hypothetical protein PsyrH_20175 [Pseudomonas syringae pv. syringae HS191]|nr:hypothetical protein PsyrH_20175 [Pseudomonas syringae pv. syringae HS191]